MWVPRAASFAAATLLVSIALVSSAEAQAPPDSLKFSFGAGGNGVMFLKSNNQLNDTAQSPPVPCGTAMPAQAPAAFTLGTWALDPTTAFPPEPAAEGGNGTGAPGPKHYTVLADSWTFNVDFTAPPPPAGTQPTAAFTIGFTLRGTLRLGGGAGDATVASSNAPVVPQGVPGAQSLTFAFNQTETNYTAHSGGPISVVVTATPTQPGPHNFAVECGPDSKLNNVVVYRGAKGESDQDGDGVPDGLPGMPGDSDIDNDGVANTAEATLATQCRYKDDGVAPNFVGTAAQQPNDHDGDGFADRLECEKNSNPLDANSVPPRERTLLDILLPFILILIVVGLIAAIVFVFLKYGKSAAVAIVSTAELFIPPGTKGKYEVAVANLAKKGEPRTYQLVVEGMPEGWDAKLNVDHLTLDPQGGAQNRGVVWLEVEAPQRPEPESAVVKVKAVPLNKAGRKDTMKLPGKAETITSINVPPGSKVPVKRGGQIVPAEPGGAESPGAAGVPLITLGADEASVKKLSAAGVDNSEQLRTGDAGALAKKTKIPEATLTMWQQVGNLVRLGITPQQAGALVQGGIGSVGVVANSAPADVGTKAGVDEKTGKAWVKGANKWVKAHPEEAVGGPAVAAAAASVPAMPSAPSAAMPAPAAKPQLQVGGLKHEPPAFRQGETVKSSVSVTNNGGAQSTIKLSLFVNDGLADVQTVTVKAGKAKDVQFKWTAQEKNKLNIRGEVVPA